MRERTFERVKDVPAFRDTMRVNLSLAGRCCVLYARWPYGLPGSKERVEEALTALGAPTS